MMVSKYVRVFAPCKPSRPSLMFGIGHSLEEWSVQVGYGLTCKKTCQGQTQQLIFAPKSFIKKFVPG
jgi:hypothetical protein